MFLKYLKSQKMGEYSSFFTTTFKLSKEKRRTLFTWVCIPVRCMVGLLFLLLKHELVLSYIATIWGMLWLETIVYDKKWIERRDTPPWWRGLHRITYRFGFAILLLSFGLTGIVSDEDRHITNLGTAIAIWIDVLAGSLDYYTSTTINQN